MIKSIDFSYVNKIYDIIEEALKDVLMAVKDIK